MSAMQALGWLEKDTEGGHYWFPGPKAREFLRVPGRSSEYADDEDSGPDVDTDEPAEADIVATGGSSRAPGQGEIDEALATIDVHASGEKISSRRRDLLRGILVWIRTEEEVSPAELRARFYPDAELVDGVEKSEAADAVGYGSEHSWWKNFVYQALSAVEVVETGGEGSHTWFYVGEDST